MVTGGRVVSRRPFARRATSAIGVAWAGSALIAAVALVLLLSETAVGADPTPGPVGLIAGDPRSEGVGPGLVGSPLSVLVAVVALGVATAVITAVLARLLQRR
jgi:hypothetical protein